MGNIFTLFYFFMYTFLAIFVATAIVSLLSLLSVVKLERPIRNKLFYGLLMEVAGCVIGYVWVGIRLETNGLPITEKVLLSEKWYWQYSPRNWMTEASFAKADGKLTFSAITYYNRYHGGTLIKTPIFIWKNEEPIKIPADGREIRFRAIKTVLPAAKEVYKGQHGEPGDGPDAGDCKVMITLRSDFSMSGVWIDEIPEKPSRGGIFLVKGE